jgi:hypothetical protein
MKEAFEVVKSEPLVEFKAEKPVKPWNYWLRIVFPPMLLWDLIKYATNTMVGDYVGKNYIIPAALYLRNESLGHNCANFREERDIESAANLPVKIHKFKIETYDNAALGPVILNV